MQCLQNVTALPVRKAGIVFVSVVWFLFLFLLMGNAAQASASTKQQSDPPSLEVMAGQMLMAGFRGYSVDADSPIVQDIVKRHLGGVVLFDYDVALQKAERNIASPQQVSALNAALQQYSEIPLLIAVDQEGGRVQRLKEKWGFSETPSAQELGAGDPQVTRAAGEQVGSMLREHGFTMDYAPVVDVNVNPQSPAIGAIGRSFSADPEMVTIHAKAFAEGLSNNGIVPCIKHFPGHGSAASDSHHGVTDVTASWKELELKPYRQLIEQGFNGIIMTAHVFNARLDEEHPATLSKATITGVLRQRLGWDGVVITDDMNMQAVRSRYGMRESIKLAILAGADIILYGNNLHYDPDAVRQAHETIMELVNSGEIPLSRIQASYERVKALKERWQ